MKIENLEKAIRFKGKLEHTQECLKFLEDILSYNQSDKVKAKSDHLWFCFPGTSTEPMSIELSPEIVEIAAKLGIAELNIRLAEMKKEIETL